MKLIKSFSRSYIANNRINIKYNKNYMQYVFTKKKRVNAHRLPPNISLSIFSEVFKLVSLI